ncbi:monovalent cation/H+ antiporter subunit D [Xanthobacter tagetidis]|uniref:Monovalent cation/H+ antiporter subunit D n=1 Tax=Xanthobacter tagetidis TaxID=60216 RepID=A0A3L7ABN1_9HYPH|nr:monovalent cation/H+ antiporter subunit D [Xanthobacter tagetidis]MBB6306067.1 multicomponent K+:H+ antiporter subunit D [Xanthobacter tagetidis]RLP77627.1 monovalent cation/H+ antiporter subunit D [Xanthobacter tagetidis]
MQTPPLSFLVVLPVLLPLMAGAFLLLFDDRLRTLKVTVSLGTILALLAMAVTLLVATDRQGAIVQAVGNWPAPFGIVLVADRLSAMMLVLTALLACASFVFALARWHRAGPRFYSIFLFLLMGLNGAFLTGDLFNLFVFFEVMLAASYGLVLHGSGIARVKAGLHYIPINLVASSLFLVGVSLIYGVTGTLNMADLAGRIPAIGEEGRTLFEAGAAILAVAFLVKAAMWPLNFWLPTTYSAASAPAAAMFAMMTKVGIYVILRLSLLLFGADSGPSAGFGAHWLLYGGLATIAFGTVGVLASQSMPRLAGYSVLVSSGTLLSAIGFGDAAIIAGALYYLASSTLAICAFFLLIELVERGRAAGADVIAVSMEVFGDGEGAGQVEEEVGTALPMTMAALGGAFFICALLLAGLPPLPGFLAKFAMMSALMTPSEGISGSAWALIALLALSGFAALVAMARTGITTFWVPMQASLPSVKAVEFAPVAGILVLCVAMTVFGSPVMRFMTETSQALHAPSAYVGAVMPAPPAAAAPAVPEAGR